MIAKSSVSFALVISLMFSVTYALLCYDCYDTGPTNEKCVRSRNCTGRACLLYEGPDLGTTTAFCLLTLPAIVEQKTKIERQCWLEPDGKGKHCMCAEDFCNRLRDRTQVNPNDALSLPISNATMIKRNPLIDYDELLDEDDVGMNSRPAPSNILFPAAAEIDLQTAGDGAKNLNADDDDLVPIEHENYEYDDERGGADPKGKLFHKSNQRPGSSGTKPSSPQEGSSRAGIALPPYMILLAGSAATFARLFS